MNDKEALQAGVEMLRKRERDIENVTLFRADMERRTFNSELEKAEAKRLKVHDTAQQGLNLNEKMKEARRKKKG